jgi:tRNA-(ms[2]io[6]A)-hydroxylase
MQILRRESPPEWLACVLADFDTFLVDHAACERKVSAAALWFVVRYPDREALIEPMIELAREELDHFQQVYRRIARRGLRLGRDVKDPYMNRLHGCLRHGRDAHLLDRLIIGGLVEARGCERFGLLAQALTSSELREFYSGLATDDARHHRTYMDLAAKHFDEGTVRARVDELLDLEARAMAEIPIRCALH